MKLIKLAITSAALAAAAVAMPAVAQQNIAGPWYVGIGLGQSFGSGGNSSGTVGGTTYNTSGFDQHKTSFQVNGGYQFTPQWGLEVQYTALGKRDGTITGGAFS